MFQALDYGLSQSEEHQLSPSLENLIERMTGSDSDDEDNMGNTQIEADKDEGIENDADDEENKAIKMTLQDVIQVRPAILKFE